VLDLLDQPADEIEREFMNGPRTIVHGDAKVANFAFDPESATVWAFDWAIAGCAPAGVDLGWYLCLNASRIAESKEGALTRYRSALDAARGRALTDVEWTPLERCTIAHGAMMGLWSKAFLLENNSPGADREWDWWMDRITSII
jgi:aminoglycoside phosphotransferase (APT) family kinase protein